MIIGVQYYRAPFPEEKHWDDDFRRIKEAGIDAVQLWLLWGWIESTPGVYDFSDYDKLFDLAQKHGLKVVASTIGEIQPLWIFRAEPGSEMIGISGRKVLSTQRQECNFGITPGGCIDHPGVRRRMMDFIAECGRHFGNHPALHGWDIWNELRWDVQAEELVCYCPHTMGAWHQWLERKFGSLEALNAAWKRRYITWDDVHPGSGKPDRTYTEYMSWQHFLSDRANVFAGDRYKAMRAVDPVHPITAHGDGPTPLRVGNQELTAMNRGNDWGMVEYLDGIGTSSFPLWEGIDDADFGARIEMVSSAAGDKLIWLSELQGGRAATGFNLYQSVPADIQQHWVWTGFCCGADAVLFWCWRDEVFGRESGGFGLAGLDGLAEERLAAMRASSDVLRANAAILNDYKPDRADVVILFNPQDYYLNWAQCATARMMADSLTGYFRAFTRNAIPARFAEAAHLDGGVLNGAKLLVLPHTLALSDAEAAKVLDFAAQGGTVLCESECGAFSHEGFMRYPDERFLTAAGIAELGRRACPEKPIVLNYAGETFQFTAEQWSTPVNVPEHATVLATTEFGPTAIRVPYGKGAFVYIGTYIGQKGRKDDAELERFVKALAQSAGCNRAISVVSPAAKPGEFLYFRSGIGGGKRQIYVFFPTHCTQCRLDITGIPERRFRDLFSQQILTATTDGDRVLLDVPASRFGLALLMQDDGE